VRVPPFDWWRTVFFLIPSIAVYTIVLGTVSLISTVYDARGYVAHWCARLWAWLILATTGVAVRLEGRDEVCEGETYVFVSNHQSIYDIPIIFSALPFQLRIIAKQSLARFPFLGWHLSRAGHMLVDRKSPNSAGILKRWKGLVTQGLSLLVFPEGTRSADGHVRHFKAGSFLLAMQAGLPIVPISVARSRHVMQKGRLRTCPGQVDLVVHPPIETKRDREPTVEDARRLAERVRQQIMAVVEQRQGGTAATTDAGVRS
jgi:1-acyl-sn-glycerol-3-phosphate acyltransferase